MNGVENQTMQAKNTLKTVFLEKNMPLAGVFIAYIAIKLIAKFNL